jgi:hypothetical protein
MLLDQHHQALMLDQAQLLTQLPHQLDWAPNLTPKELNVRTADKPVLGNITLSHFIFRFFETFCEHAPQNKLCGSTNFMIFGPTDQKLWMFESFKRSLGRAGMCWSQPARVDYISPKGGLQE